MIKIRAIISLKYQASSTSDVPLSPRLNDTLVTLLVDPNFNILTPDKRVGLHELPPHIRFGHDNLAPLFVHAIDRTHGLVELPARGHVGGAAPDV